MHPPLPCHTLRLLLALPLRCTPCACLTVPIRIQARGRTRGALPHSFTAIMPHHHRSPPHGTYSSARSERFTARASASRQHPASLPAFPLRLNASSTAAGNACTLACGLAAAAPPNVVLACTHCRRVSKRGCTPARALCSATNIALWPAAGLALSSFPYPPPAYYPIVQQS